MGRVDQVTKVKGMFVHPSQAQAIIARFPEVEKFQIVVTRENEIDRMSFRIELKSKPDSTTAFRERVASAIQAGLKLRPELEFVPLGSLEETEKLIIDKRNWD